MDTRTWNKKSAIIREGDEGDEIFFIRSGKVRVMKIIDGTEVDLADLGPGDFFGEMSMLLGSHRTATAVALTDAEISSMDKESFLASIRSDPATAEKVIRTLAGRLQEAHDIIRELEGQRKAFMVLLSPFEEKKT
jgi:CRP-like cAMP-binding protein